MDDLAGEVEAALQKTSPKELREILMQHYPDEDIYVVMGFSMKNKTSYVQNAFFNEQNARIRVDLLRQRKNCRAVYHVVPTTTEKLLGFRTREKAAGRTLKEHDLGQIYQSLANNIFSPANI